MAGKTYTQKIQFQGSFDGTEVLSGLKKIRQSMSDAGADASLFKGVDKDIAATEKLINDMLAQIQKGFSSTKEVANFEKQLEKLGLSFSKINVGLQDINKASNFNLNADEVKKYTTELERLTNQQERLKQAAKDSVATQLQSAKLNAKERKAIMDEVEANGDLEAAVKKVAQAKEKAAKAKHGTAALDTETGKSFISGVSGVGLDELGVTAKSGHSKKGRNDARERNARGVLTGNIDETKANAAAIESYRKALEETIKTSGTAADAIEAMKKAMDEYGLELGDTSKLLDSFDRDMQEFQATALSSSQRGAISRAQTLGSTNASGEFELSGAGQELANNAQYQAMRQNIDDIAESQENLNRATEEGTRQVERYVQEQAEGLNHSVQEQEHFEAAARESIDALKDQSETAQAVNDKFEDMKGAVKTFLSIGSAISGVRQIIQQTFNDIKELDKSFAEIAMVTEYSVQQMWQSYDQYAEMANKLGQSTQSVIQASGLFYQQGLDTEESLALTEDTMKLATLAGLDFAEATSQMTAALRGFHMEMDEGARVTDVYSELAAKAAADVQGIAYAMSKTASIASSAGMEFETTSAFLTQMIETTQEAPENIGTAMKTIIARFTELKENVAGTVDSEFDDLDYNKVDTALKSVGVSLKDTNGQFRDLDDVFLELSEKWNTLDRNSQRYIATIAAGSRQQSRFIAMMENYDRTIELVNTAYDSAGRASEQFAKYQDTVEYKMNQIQNSWEQLRTNFFDSDTYKGALDIFKKFIDTLNNMDAKQFIGIGIIGLTLGKTVITNFIKSLQSSTQSITTSFNTILSSSIQKIKTAPLAPKLQNWFNESMEKIKLEAPTQALQQAGVETSLISQKNSELLLKYVQEKQQLSEIKKEMQLLEAKGADISEDELQKLNYLRQQTEELKKQKKETATQLKNSGITYDQIDQASRDQKLNRRVTQGQTLSKAKSSLGAAGKDALSSGITTALMMAISGVDFSTVIKTAGISALSAAIPSIISAVMPLVTSILTGPVGIVAVIATAVIGGAYLITKSINDANKAAKQAELNRLKAVEKTNNELQKQQEQNLLNYQNKTSEKETLNKDIKRYQELSSKAYLNTSEQEELEKIAANFNENYPDIIKTYDENTSNITFNTIALENLNDTLQEEIEQERIKIATNSNQQIGNYTNASVLTGQNLENYKQSVENSISTWGISKATINSMSDANLYEKYGINGYIIDEDTRSEQEIALNIQSLLTGIDKEFAKQAGITEDLYESSVNNNVIDFIETLREANIGLGQFNSMVIKAAETQEDAYNNKIIEAERQRIKNSLQTMEGIDISEEISDILSYAAEDNAEVLKDQSKTAINSYFKDISDAFSGYGGADENKDFLRAIEDWSFSRMAQNDTDISKMKSALESLGYSEEENKEEGLKSISDLFSSGTNAVEYDELSTQMQESLIAIGYSSEDWNNNRKTAAEMTKILQELMTYNMLAQDNILPEGLDPETLKQNMPAISNFEQIINDYAEKTFEEYTQEIEDAKNQISDENLKNTINKYYAESEDSIVSQWQNAIDSLEEIGINDINNLSYKAANSLNQMIKDLNLSENKRAEIVDIINENTKGLSQTQKDILFSIDLTQSYGDLLLNSEDYINKLVSAGMNATDAAELFNNYIKQASLILSKALFGIDSANIFREQLNTKISNFKENYQSIFDAQEEFIEKGSLSSETYFKLLEDGFEDYVDITKDGYILLGKSAEEAWTTMTMQPKEELENQIEINRELLKQAKEIDTSFSITWDDNSVENGLVLKKTYDNFNDLIAHYQKYGSHVEGITDKQKEYIEAITQAGYATEEEYIKALEEGTMALENMRPDVYIQGLVNLSESMTSATEKVNDLKEELEELNEQLEDDKTALAEAEDELRQAIHGSDDFQSSLDGLVNYTEKIERLDKAIEKTKESLEDVSNIDEAKGLMAQLSEQYKSKTITLNAENMAIDAALTNLRSTLTENYGNYISFDEEENPLIDFAYMAMDANDEIRKAFEEEYNLYNEYAQKKTDNLDAIEEIEKEKQEQRQQTLKDFVAIQEDVISILKEKAQEEIDVTKEKYDALEEADNNYLDALQEAIDKQRQLRDQENQYEDLATKEKKLALMQRDTSGANQKETQQLEKEIEDDRQQLLNNEVDDLIESMKELYDKQKEARDAEIEYMETVTENTQYFAEWASNIMSDWQSVDDMQAWYLENDPSAQDMTIEQTEVYLNEIEDKYSDYLQYVAVLATDFTTEQEELNSAINEMYNNTKTNVENIGTVTQEMAQIAADKTIEEATRARDEAKDKLDETKQKITETEQTLKTAEDNAVLKHGEAMNAMIEASKEAMEDVSTYAAKQLIEFEAVDLQSPESVQSFAEKYNFYNKETREYSHSFVNALTDKGYDTSNMTTGYRVYQITGIPEGTSTTVDLFGGKTFSSRADAEDYLQKHKDEISDIIKYISVTADLVTAQTGAYKYATGGLVDYTGLAQVDGTPNKPEAFLSAEDTARIGAAAKLLANLPIFNATSNAENAVSTNIGDTSIEIHINVENISDDYDVDQMIERVKQDIVDVAKPIGTSVILNK